ncbi:MAG: M23 family metallopeptidase [Bacteroidales bacterium]|nr:M23 family metallopeptidase [Bacteroidales bacterium]MCR5064743.1 M23 family metallopeptidase [Bacteroidales bacterium]
MKKHHTYKFNPHTLSYEKVKTSFVDKLKKVSFTVAFGIVLGVVLMVIGLRVFESPRQKKLARELDAMERQMENMRKVMKRNEAVLADLENRDNSIYRTLLQAEPIVDSVRRAGMMGQSYDEFDGYDHSDVIKLTAKRLDDFTKRLYIQSKSFDEVYKMASNKQERLNHVPAIMPLRKNSCSIISGFGTRYHPILHYRRMHTGVDLSAKTGTPIYATGDGTVQVAGRSDDLSGYGIAVLINHGYGYQTLYGHMNDVKVRQGQKVKRGELLGHVGSTGLASGPHCHYEVWLNGNKVNPIYYFFNDLTPHEYEQVIEAANQENQCLS